MKKKYKFTRKTKKYLGVTLKQIRRISDGKIGGWIEKESNLSHEGDCWVYGNAMVYGNAKVFGNAMVSGNANIYERAHVFGNAMVSGNAEVSGNAVAFGDAHVHGNAMVSGDARVYERALVYGNARVYGNDKLTGEITNLINLCEFSITASITDKYIRVGCQSKSFSEWRTYVKSKSTEYLKDCKDEESHKECVKLIKFILKKENAWKG